MIDYFALALSHFLLVVALIRMVGRDELDREDPGAAPAVPEPPRTAEERS